MKVKTVDRDNHNVVKILMSPQDLADKFGMPVSQVRTAIQTGDIPIFMISHVRMGRFGIDLAEHEQYIAEGWRLANQNGLSLWQALRAIKIGAAVKTESESSDAS